MTQKIFLTKTGKATITCPECGKIRQIDVTKFVHTTKKVKLKVTCKCNHIFFIFLERRMDIRREVNLSGILFADNNKHSIQIFDFSRRGMRFSTKETLNLNPGNKIVVKFTLDDVDSSKISKNVIVKNIDHNYIGVEFLAHEHHDKLGTYLLFHFG